jgi:ankyrin repeat protein
MKREPPVYRLIQAGFDSPEEMLAILRKEPELLEERTGLGETALHYLSVENQLRAVTALVEVGAQVNTLNECNQTPLSEAASLGYDELVKYLLSKGAKLHVSGQDDPTLHAAVRGGNSEVVKHVLAAGALIDERNGIKETALHLAAEDEKLDILELLLGAGADPRLKRIFGETPLDLAISAGRTACTQALLAAGAPRGEDAA